MVDQISFSSQQDMQTRGTKLVALFSQFTLAIPDQGIILWFDLIAVTAPALSNYNADLPLAELMILSQRDNHTSSVGRH
jgi:hypothetical protein